MFNYCFKQKTVYELRISDRSSDVCSSGSFLKNDNNPDIIFTHYQHDLHQDHRLLSDLTWNTFRNHLILEYEIPKYDGDLGRSEERRVGKEFCSTCRSRW